MGNLDFPLGTRIGTMNRCASQRRGPERGVCDPQRGRFMESLGVIISVGPRLARGGRDS